jgi:type II secretory pathway component PulF
MGRTRKLNLNKNFQSYGDSYRVKRYWTMSQQQKFLERFTQLVANGFSIFEALQVCAVLFDEKYIQTIAADCELGLPFADILEKLYFESRTVYMIRCSEQSGALLQGLENAQNYSRRHLENQKELQKKLRYPAFLFMIMVVVLVAVYLFFIPQLDSFYESFNIDGNHTAMNSIVLIIGVALGLVAALIGLTVYYLKYCKERFRWLFQSRFVCKLTRKLFSYYFGAQWLMFIECGLALKETLSMIQAFEKVPLIRVLVAEMEARLESGEELEDVIAASNYFTPYFKLIMAHALKIGCVKPELAAFAKTELAALNTLVATAFKIFQSIFLLLIGSMIILLYLSILQPVFEMVNIL